MLVWKAPRRAGSGLESTVRRLGKGPMRGTASGLGGRDCGAGAVSAAWTSQKGYRDQLNLSQDSKTSCAMPKYLST